MKPLTRIVTAMVASIAVLITIACSSGDSATATLSATDVPGATNVTEVAAPIESVKIEKIEAKAPNATLKVVSGGLNSCETFKDYALTRDGDAFRLQVTNLRESAPGVPCMAIYGTLSHDIELPSDAIEACETYTVEVNGETYSVPSSCPSVPSGQFEEPTPTPPAAGPAEWDMVSIPASILSAEVLAAESFPVQYFLQIESGLRNGCIEFEGYEVQHEGKSIRVTVTNLEPEDQDVACIEIHRTVSTNIRLGSGADFDPATTYTVQVNDATTSFTTEGEAPAPGRVAATFDSPFQLKTGQTALIDRQGPAVEFVEVVEDSRCALDVVCIQAGRARVLLQVSSPGDVLGFGTPELTLEAGLVDPEAGTVTGVFDEYRFELSVLDPYPKTTAPQPPDYTATMVVTKVRPSP
ncbi:MAG: hypothetical protein QF714_13895 [Dehalococcoidia bacterium]|nr:hypothetical protein [Dehalococcoidia bacterium]